MTGSVSNAAGEKNPYVGPRPFRPGEKLHGRETELAELEYQWKAERILLLHSPSGAGKSSLIHAGLLPRLKNSFDLLGPTRVNQEYLNNDANRYVLSALHGFEEGVPERLRRSTEELAHQSLEEYIEKRPRRRSAPKNVALVFDQFEEILTADPLALEAKREFFDQLGKLLLNPRIWALFVLREDYLAPLDPYAEQVPTHLKNRFRIDLLNLEAAREAILRPALDCGRQFSAVDQLLHDLSTMQVQQADGSFVSRAGHYVEPVQLQVVCFRLWESMPPEDRTIDAEDLRQFGNVTEALGAYYADSMAAIAQGEESQERMVRDWIGERLITSSGVRGQVLRGEKESGGLPNNLVERVLDTHLVRAEQRAGATWYELAHDRLIEPVRNDNAVWRSNHLAEIQQRAELWEKQGRPPGMLLRGGELREAEEMLESSAFVSRVEERYFEESNKAHVQYRREKRLFKLIGWLGAAAIVAGIVAVYAAIDSVEQAQIARSRRLAVASTQMAERNREISDLLAVEAVRVHPTRAAEEALRASLARPGRPVQLFSGHEKEVFFAAWSPDQRWIVSSSRDGTVRLWDPAGGAGGGEARVIKGHEAGVLEVDWDPDGRRLVTASYDGTSQVILAETGEIGVVLDAHESSVYSARWHPQGGVIATASFDGSVRIWDPATAEELQVLVDPEAEQRGVRIVAWQPQAERYRLLSAGADGVARIWDGWPLSLRQRLRGHLGMIIAASWHPTDENLVMTAGRYGTARIWDAANGRELLALEIQNELYAARWSPDGGKLATASADGIVRIWTLAGSSAALEVQGTQLLEGHDGAVTGIAWNARGDQLVSISEDGSGRVWNAASGQQVALLAAHHSGLRTVAWSADGTRVVTAGADHDIRIWEVEAGAERGAYEIGSQVHTVAWEPGSRRLAVAGHDKAVRVLDTAADDTAGNTAAQNEQTLTGHTADILGVAWAPGGERLATASRDGTVRIWEGDSSLALTGHQSAVRDVAWSPDGQRLASASLDSKVFLWDAETGEVQRFFESYPERRDWFWTVEWSPDGRRILGASYDRTVRIWEADGDDQRVLEGHGSLVVSASFSPDGQKVVSGGFDRTVRLWNAASGEPLHELQGHRGWVLATAYSPANDLVVSASGDRTARIWDAAEGTSLHVLEGHEGPVRHAVWSPDGRWVVTSSDDGTARLWDAENGEEHAILEGHRGRVHQAAWHPDGIIATASFDGSVRLYEMDVEKLLDLACARAVRNLTDEEWNRFLQTKRRDSCALGES